MKRDIRNNILKVLMIAIVALSLTNCGSYKSLKEAPEVDTNDLVRDTRLTTDTTSIASIPWKEYFTDQNLQSLIEEGLKNNVDMQIALSRVKQAEATLMMSRGAKLPSVSGVAQITHTQTNGSGENSVLATGINQNQLGVSASWQVDLWGRLNSLAKSDYAGLLNSYEYQKLIQTSLVANIASMYYNLLALDEQLQITKESISLLEKNAETMIALKDAGQQTAAAVAQSNATLYATQLTIPDLERQIREQENTLSLLLGRKPGDIIRSDFEKSLIPNGFENEIPAQAIANRPDVRQAELNLLSAYALKDAAKASFYPSLSLNTASFGFMDTDFTNFFDPANLALQIVGGLTQPIFRQKQLKGNLEVAKENQKQALVQFEYAALAAGQEISNVLYGYETLQSRMEYRSQQIESLKGAVAYTQELLGSGEANYLEVLTAQRNLLGAELNEVSDRLQELNYTVLLYQALGGGIY